MSGITALCELGGAPIAKADLAALGLGETPASFAGHVTDPGLHPLADACSCDHRSTLVLGWPAGAEFEAACKTLPGKADRSAAMRLLLDRFGPALPERVDGEWLLLDWQPGRLTLVQSRVRRDWLFVARRGDRVAICGDIRQIAALDWVGRELDPLGFAASFGRGPLRAGVPRQTILPGVQRLEPGEFLILTPGCEHRHRAALPDVEHWQGSFAEAVEAARELLHRIIAERLAVAGPAGLLLSGGLDSSTLAALVTDLAGSASGMPAFTSVAPQTGGLIDERAEAAAVAARLGLQHIPVLPDCDVLVYRPAPEAYSQAGGPTLSPRHYLYRALARAAQDHGVATLFDGAFGELSLTSYMPLETPRYRLRQVAKRLLGRGGDTGFDAPYHIRMAPHRAAALRPAVAELVARHRMAPASRKSDDAWGWIAGFDKSWQAPAILDHGVRGETPFRDPRLLALFAGFPARFLVHEGLNRAPARAMMAGRLPEEIRLRQTTGPFSPDYMTRIGSQAHAVLDRFATFRQAGADDWIDLGWLETALQQVGTRGPQSIAEAFEVQLTTMAAEFLVWWRGAG
ncbi:MAG: asparagine synthase-related protein [Novosphingobium sp.]